jgi:RNA recognition motif-containing protein
VGNLGNEVTDDGLKRAFTQYKSLSKARVVRDKRNMKSKGYGFVSFLEPQDFLRAMKEMQGVLHATGFRFFSVPYFLLFLSFWNREFCFSPVRKVRRQSPVQISEEQVGCAQPGQVPREVRRPCLHAGQAREAREDCA